MPVHMFAHTSTHMPTHMPTPMPIHMSAHMPTPMPIHTLISPLGEYDRYATADCWCICGDPMHLL